MSIVDLGGQFPIVLAWVGLVLLVLALIGLAVTIYHQNRESAEGAGFLGFMLMIYAGAPAFVCAIVLIVWVLVTRGP